MKSWLRHHSYALRIAIKRLKQNPLSTLANIFVIALVLCVPIIGATILQTSQPIVQEFDINPEITLFLNNDATATQKNDLMAQIKQEPSVANAKSIPKDEALKTLKSNDGWSQALEALDYNPLPDAIMVTLVETKDMSAVAQSLANKWQKLEAVDSAQLDDEWVKRLESLLNFIKYGISLMAAAVAVVVLATVFNTVRLQALSQREEISVARLVGATESFVRRPFLYLGAITGLTAFLLSLLLTQIALTGLNVYLGNFANSYGLNISLQLPGITDLMLSGLVIVILGAIAARLSVTRYRL